MWKKQNVYLMYKTENYAHIVDRVLKGTFGGPFVLIIARYFVARYATTDRRSVVLFSCKMNER